ncbi:MAG: tetratricopeptide repeat protein [Saprospiraceae bacterium]|nr:tetratricopeptide repeat protein [Saprospiraceae bacterium]
MKHRFLALLAILTLPIILDSCVTKKKRNETGAVGKFYHNTTSYYNGYWNANEILKESMRTLRAANVDDYNKILEVEDYISIDNPKMVKGDMDKIIEKVTTVAQLHEPSDWVDDCYVMMAKAQYLKQEFETTEETLEYFQEDFNPSNPYGRNYKSKKLTGKAAKKVKEAETKEKAKLKEAEKEKKEEEKKQLAEEKEAEKKLIAEEREAEKKASAKLKEEERKNKEEERKAEIKLKEEEKESKEAARKAEVKSKEQKKKETEKERERLKKEKEKQRKEDAKNRKKGIKTNKPVSTPKTQEVKQPEVEKPEVIQPEVKQPQKPAEKKPLKVTEQQKSVDIQKTDNKVDEPSKKEVAKSPKTVKEKEEEKEDVVASEKQEKPKKPDADKTAYSEGLLWLAKTYIKRENWFSAEMLLQKLEKSAISDEIKSELPATYANLYIKQKKYDEATPKLLQAIDEEGDKQLKARYAYILAQLYQNQKNHTKALEYFTISKKYARTPKLAFMAELATAKTSIQSGSKSKSGALSDLQAMLKDTKNSDVKDQIYFTIAEIELSQNNFELAVENFRNSLAHNVSDQKLKTESYYHIAQLQYQNERYLEASAYYDSTLANLPVADSRYIQVQKLANNLKDIATNIENMTYLDTLLYFVSLSADERKKAIPPYLARNQKKQTLTGSGNIVTKNPFENFGNVDFGQSSFFAYNKSTKAQGKESFEKIWGKRALNDDWRRSARSISTEEDNNANKIAESSGTQPEIANVEEYERFLRELPTNPIKKQETNDRIMNAMFTLGKLFRDKIENYSKSATTLENMNSRFGTTSNEAESFFYLYLDYMDLGNKSKAEEYKNRLSSKHPQSNYNAILANASDIKKSGGVADKADQHYKTAYTLFESGRYAEAVALLDKTPEVAGENHNYHAKIMLLKAMCQGGQGGKDAYIRGLNEVISNYPNTPEHLKAREIMRLLGGDQSAFTTVKDVDNRYERETNVTHYAIVITYNIDETKYTNLKVAVSEYNKKHFKNERLQQGDATLNIEENTQIILVRKFENEEKAIQYANKAIKDKSEFSNNADYTFDVLPISQANYRKMLSDRSSGGYRTFYENVILTLSGNK